MKKRTVEVFNGVRPLRKGLYMKLSVEERYFFWVHMTSECWIWLGQLYLGYGRYRGSGAHRYMYEAINGPVDVSLHIDHLCRNRAKQRERGSKATASK